MRIFLGHELACLLLFQLRKKLVAPNKVESEVSCCGDREQKMCPADNKDKQFI